ncbi:MAG: MgtC/SapB family protein [Candidatus Hydrogenedentes bacterium]|nr:MgtC/SapB family protein [Candidatus Hydrogenedentota bacterium]
MIEILPDILWRLTLAVLLAGAIGMERGRRGYSAGLRTHVLVCLGATLAMIVSDVIAREMVITNPAIPFDKTRMAAGVITGVGFLGAGTIMHVGTTQRGLTTAAMIWFVAMLGIVIGVGLYVIAASATAFALIVAICFEFVEKKLPMANRFSVAIRMPSGLQQMQEIEEAIRAEGFQVEASRLKISGVGESVDMNYQVVSKSPKHVEQLAIMLQKRFTSATRIVCER